MCVIVEAGTAPLSISDRVHGLGYVNVSFPLVVGGNTTGAALFATTGKFCFVGVGDMPPINLETGCARLRVHAQCDTRQDHAFWNRWHRHA